MAEELTINEKWLNLINNALMNIGLPLADNLDDSDYNARYVIKDSLRLVLRSYPWGWATKYVKLTASQNPPTFGYLYLFDYPNDYIRLLDVYSGKNVHAPKASLCISLEGILSNVTPLYARYVCYVEDPDKWPADFKEAVCAKVASKIAPLSAQTQAMTPSLIQLYQYWLTQAQGIDSTETSERVPMDEDIYMARTGQATQH